MWVWGEEGIKVRSCESMAKGKTKSIPEESGSWIPFPEESGSWIPWPNYNEDTLVEWFFKLSYLVLYYVAPALFIRKTLYLREKQRVFMGTYMRWCIPAFFYDMADSYDSRMTSVEEAVLAHKEGHVPAQSFTWTMRGKIVVTLFLLAILAIFIGAGYVSHVLTPKIIAHFEL